MDDAILNEVANLLINARKHSKKSNSSELLDYASLKQLTLKEELCAEILILQTFLTNPTTFLENFKRRCLERTQRNADSCLSFMAQPDGACNTLYWQIATLIADPATLGDMMAIILPMVNQILTIEFSCHAPAGKNAKKKRLENVELAFKLEDVTTLIERPVSSNLLKRFVQKDNLLFDVTSIERFNFSLHQQFYEKIMASYPTLANVLYRHNHFLESLLYNLELIATKGQTPRKVFTYLMHQLELGSNKMTGRYFASTSAQAAYLHCIDYLRSLPEKLHSELLVLDSDDGREKTVKAIFIDLQEGGCIEVAAQDLCGILDNNLNANKLDIVPLMSEDQKKEIINYYNYRTNTHYFIAEGAMKSTVLPLYWLEKLLPRIKIRIAEDYLNIFISFPISYYQLIFQYVTFKHGPRLPERLGKMIAQGVFNPEQLAVLNQVIVSHAQKFGGLTSLLFFAAKADNLELLIIILNRFTEEEHLTAIKGIDPNGNNLLHLLANKPIALEIILRLIPKEERLGLMSVKNYDGNTILELAANNSHALWIIFNELSNNNCRLYEVYKSLDEIYSSLNEQRKKLFIIDLTCRLNDSQGVNTKSSDTMRFFSTSLCSLVANCFAKIPLEEDRALVIRIFFATKNVTVEAIPLLNGHHSDPVVARQELIP